MVNLIEIRVTRLARISDHYRELADNLRPDPVSAEITAIADEIAGEAAQLRRRWVRCWNVDREKSTPGGPIAKPDRREQDILLNLALPH